MFIQALWKGLKPMSTKHKIIFILYGYVMIPMAYIEYRKMKR